MSTHTVEDATINIPAQAMSVPVQIQVGGGGGSSTSSTTSPAPPARSWGWLWGVLGTLIALALIGKFLPADWCDAPVPVAPVDYSGNLGRLEQKIDAVGVSATQAAQYGEANHRLIVPVAKRVAQTGEAVDQIGGVVYDADGKVKDTETLAEAIEAANLAAGAATRAELARQRVVVRRVEVPGVPAPVDLSGLNARFDSLEAAISARANAPGSTSLQLKVKGQ